ncbi:serine protease AprX [Croceifilum oryzae]|uniref:Serine protease AprX n=1 Tax=Croceifilum oryzae TaxID=1553429 RepID=A0AAJ1TLN4_9BACL|nr:S8 family peptidase [Croceifilum oryzae]MDQ0418817.1 serine protease AprX [Croceifilum oryzae]
MQLRKREWYEKYAHRLDPDLRVQLSRKKQLDKESISVSYPIIIQLDKEESVDTYALADWCASRGGSVLGEIPLIDSIYGEFSAELLEELVVHHQVEHLYLDRRVYASLDLSAKSTGVRQLQLERNLMGTGITIAILDTGLFPHPDLINPVSRIVGFIDLVQGKTDYYDDHGHGTHCAGSAAGNGFSSQGIYMGAAPEAKIVGVKVLDQHGGGKLSTVVRGIEWCVMNQKEYQLDILSLSLGAPAIQSYRKDPLAQASRIAWHNGIMVCTAAGNDGPKPGTISSPGHDPLILTVGAAYHEVAMFSSRGPTKDGWMKPDLYAPGTDIISLNVPGSELELQFLDRCVDDHYLRLSGTSMATPYVAGICALLLEENPNLTPNDLKAILTSTAKEISGELAGNVCAVAAVELAEHYRQFQRNQLPSP